MPRKPDPTIPKRPVGRPKGTTKVARQQQNMAEQAAAVGINIPGLKDINLTPYPDLSLALAMLRQRMGQVGPQRAELIGKWVKALEVAQTGIVKLKKLEILSDSLTSGVSKPKF